MDYKEENARLRFENEILKRQIAEMTGNLLTVFDDNVENLYENYKIISNIKDIKNRNKLMAHKIDKYKGKLAKHNINSKLKAICKIKIFENRIVDFIGNITFTHYYDENNNIKSTIELRPKFKSQLREYMESKLDFFGVIINFEYNIEDNFINNHEKIDNYYLVNLLVPFNWI
jgi:hypothetical protein